MNNIKEKIIEEVSKQNLKYDYLIIKLMNQKKIDHLIAKITNTKTKVNKTTITKKRYLSQYEQFISLLNTFIYIFKEDFYFLNNTDYIIEKLLQNKRNTKFLLSKKYIGNNNNIDFFSCNIKKLISNEFYKNIKKLSKESEIINNFMKKHNIKIKKTKLNKKELENIYNILIKLSLSNAKTLNYFLLFKNINEYTKNKKHFIIEWELIIKNYYQKIDAINILLK